MNTDIKSLLRAWDGTHTQYLIDIYNRLNSEQFIDVVLVLYTSDADLQRATSWLIKHHSDQGYCFSNEQVSKILSAAYLLEHWESQLHILQLVPKLSIDVKSAESIEPFVREAMQSEKKFVKAAAYEAYYEIVKQILPLKHEFIIMCEEALRVESASVRVKVRRILKEDT